MGIGGHDHGVGSAIAGFSEHGPFEARLAWLKRRSAETFRESAAKLDRIGGKNRCTGTLHKQREDKTDCPLAEDSNGIPAAELEQLDPFEAGIHRLNPAGLIERDAGWNFFNSTIHDPIHDAHILRKAAARRFKARGDAHFLVDCALSVKAALAIETVLARYVMENNDAIAGLVFCDPVPDGGHHAGDFMTIDARGRKQIILDFF